LWKADDSGEWHLIKKYVCYGLTGLFLLLASACATTSLNYVWYDVEYQDIPIKKILVIGVFQKPGANEYFEDEFVLQLKSIGTGAYAAYRLLPDETRVNRDVIISTMEELQVDAVLVSRIVETRESGSYDTSNVLSGTSGFYGYYVLCCQLAVTQGYEVMIETKIFSREYDHLIWTSVSETVLEGTLRDILKKSFVPTVISDLKEKRLL
jgi:hypothetical protein